MFAATGSPQLLWYLPVQEFKDIDMHDHTVKLVSYLGPITTSFEGKFTMSKQDMTFRFQDLTVTLFGRTLVQRPVNFSEKLYRYFYADQGMACARSVGTGLVVFKRTSPDK